MSDNILHIYFDDSDKPESLKRDYFIITEEVKVEESREGNDWYVELSGLSVVTEGILSYETFWPHLILPNRKNLLTYVQMYVRLDEVLASSFYSEIQTHSLENGYKLVVDDISNQYSIDVDHDIQPSARASASVVSISVFVLFIDQFLSLILGFFSSGSVLNQNNPMIIPYPGRYESTLPVIRKMDDVTIVVSPLMVAWRFLDADEGWPDDIPATSLFEYTDVRVIKRQLKTLLQLQLSRTRNDLELANALERKIADEYDIYLPRTIQYICQETVNRDIRHILSFPLIEKVIRSSDNPSLVVGGQNVRERHSLKIAEEEKKATFYIPHSIVYSKEVLPSSTETVHFVAGPADERMLRERYPENRLPQLYSTGRPLLDTLNEQTGDETSQLNEEKRIILGTQPCPDWIRDDFVTKVLSQIEKSDYHGTVFIKIHPSESVKYYNKLIDPEDYQFEVRIEQGPMKDYITPFSCLITINSNVGIESILLGAYCISFNEWEPFASATSYIDGNIIPYLTRSEELNTHIDISTKVIKSRRQKQIEYIQESFLIGNSAERIAEKISAL